MWVPIKISRRIPLFETPNPHSRRHKWPEQARRKERETNYWEERGGSRKSAGKGLDAEALFWIFS
jgi:hypothetical protein